MAKESKSFVSRVKGLFGGKKMKPEQVRESLRKGVKEADEVMYGLDYDLKKRRKERDRLIQQGTKAARDKDMSKVRETAGEIKFCKMEIARLLQERDTAAKARLMCRMNLRRLEAATEGGATELAQRITQLTDDEEVTEMLTNAECSEERFQEILDKKLDLATGNLERYTNDTDQELSDEEAALMQLASAESSGNEELVKKYSATLTGEPTAMEPESL